MFCNSDKVKRKEVFNEDEAYTFIGTFLIANAGYSLSSFAELTEIPVAKLATKSPLSQSELCSLETLRHATA